jgi:hypothetical protein
MDAGRFLAHCEGTFTILLCQQGREDSDEVTSNLTVRPDAAGPFFQVEVETCLELNSRSAM